MGLFYPAILGALIYEIGPSLYSLPWTWSPARVLVFVMLVHYALDYAYSADDPSKAQYSWCKFPFDFALVWLLYAAVRTANASILEPSSVVSVCWLLLLTKICAFVWELISDRDQCARRLALASDFIPLLCYAILIFLYSSGAAMPEGVIKLLIGFVIVDAALYWVHEPMYKRCKGN